MLYGRQVLLSGNLNGIRGNDLRLNNCGVIGQAAGQCVLDHQLLKLKVGSGGDEGLLGGGDGTLGAHYVQRRQGADFHLLLIVRQRFLRQGKRTLFYLKIFIGIYQVPVNVLDLAHCGNHLLPETFFSDLLVVFCRTKKPQIQAATESLKQMLPNGGTEVARESRD